jgi:hypothetical protein
MPAVIPIIVAAAAAGGTVAAAKINSGAAGDAAATQSKAATTAAGTQATAATKTAQIQADAANRAADLQAKAAADALQFSRAQSQTSLDQYNQQQQRLTPYRNLGNFALGQPMEGNPAPLTLPNLPGQSSGQSSAANLPPPAGMDKLSDPNTWMSLVADTPALTSWVQQGLGPAAKPDLVNYYVGKIKGQPGANAQEQAGSANYWLQKLRSDPELAGGSGQATGGTAARTGPVTLSYTPQMNYSSPAAPLTPALQPPPLQYPYAPLNAIGKQV